MDSSSVSQVDCQRKRRKLLDQGFLSPVHSMFLIFLGFWFIHKVFRDKIQTCSVLDEVFFGDSFHTKLDEIKLISSRNGRGVTGFHGRLGVGCGCVVVGGHRTTHGISMHPPLEGAATAIFDLRFRQERSFGLRGASDEERIKGPFRFFHAHVALRVCGTLFSSP